MANYTRHDMQFCESTFMWDIKSIWVVLCATNVTRHATCWCYKIFSSEESKRQDRSFLIRSNIIQENWSLVCWKGKGTFSGWLGEQIACKRAYLTYLTNPIRLPELEPIWKQSAEKLGQSHYFSTVSHLTRIPNDRSSKVKSTRFFIGHGRFLQKHDTKFPKTSIMPYF